MLATEIKNLLSKFNKGVRAVEIESGIVCVCVSSLSCLRGVMSDLLMSGSFGSVKPIKSGIDGTLWVYATPK